MSHSDQWYKQNDDKIVKCACGLSMRQKNWPDHWRGCRVASEVQVEEQDRQNLLAQEERLRVEAEQHREWQKNRDAQMATGRFDVFGRVK